MSGIDDNVLFQVSATIILGQGKILSLLSKGAISDVIYEGVSMTPFYCRGVVYLGSKVVFTLFFNSVDRVGARRGFLHQIRVIKGFLSLSLSICSFSLNLPFQLGILLS